MLPVNSECGKLFFSLSFISLYHLYRCFCRSASNALTMVLDLSLERPLSERRKKKNLSYALFQEVR